MHTIEQDAATGRYVIRRDDRVALSLRRDDGDQIDLTAGLLRRFAGAEAVEIYLTGVVAGAEAAARQINGKD